MIVASNKELWEVRFTFTHVCGPNGGTVMHSAGSSSIAQWQGCCADECAMMMMKFVSWNLTFIYFEQVLGLGFGTADVSFSVWCRLAGYNKKED